VRAGIAAQRESTHAHRPGNGMMLSPGVLMAAVVPFGLIWLIGLLMRMH